MSTHDELGIRMKEYYETVPKTKLMRRCPVVCRIDGRSFYSFTMGFNRPFDEIFIKSMQKTAKYLCENVQGCVISYQQSDEISLVLIDYKKLNSSAFFDYEVQKICSITASMATMAFNKYFREYIDDFNEDYYSSWNHNKNEDKLYDIYNDAVEKGAIFDSRCFNIPKEEVTNYVYWRQLDAIRNSIQMVGQANFSHRELQNKSCNDIQNMLMTQKGIDWNSLETYKQRGSCCIKKIIQNKKDDIKNGAYIRSEWIIDNDIPIFKGNDRKYIKDLIYVGE